MCSVCARVHVSSTAFQPLSRWRSNGGGARQGYGDGSDWGHAAERIGNHVLSKCPRWLIFIEGVGYNPGAPGMDNSGDGIWWGENLAGAESQPIRLTDQTKLVYSPHTCECHVCTASALRLDHACSVAPPFHAAGGALACVCVRARACHVVSCAAVQMARARSCSRTSSGGTSPRTWPPSGTLASASSRSVASPP